jgi:hypothetical protein
MRKNFVIEIFSKFAIERVQLKIFLRRILNLPGYFRTAISLELCPAIPLFTTDRITFSIAWIIIQSEIYEHAFKRICS